MLLNNSLKITGLLGCLAAIIVGTGEYLLHYDAMARFASGGYDFMIGISESRTTAGHFFGVLGAPLYLFGCYHIYLMLRSANERAAFSAFIIGSYGFIIGTVWIGSRASVSALMQIPMTPEIESLVGLYDMRYEALINVTRVTTLVLSIIFVWLVLTGRTYYPKWMALFNPFVLILASFVVYLVDPQIGKHLMPIALNVAFFVFFALSQFFANKVSK